MPSSITWKLLAPNLGQVLTVMTQALVLLLVFPPLTVVAMLVAHSIIITSR